jgi:hypothetical protein
MVKPDVESKLNTHEEVCAIRYEQINARLKRLEQILLATAGFVIVFLLSQSYAHADTTTINNKGMPVPSAMAPSMSGFSNDMCKSGVSGGANTGMFSISGGATITDENCERIKLAKTLNDLGLKVAAVSVLCQDNRVWEAMEMSGSPCPIGGSLGYTAKRAWHERDPKRFEKLYGSTYTLPLIPNTPVE